MEFRGHHVHAASGLSPLLAQETDADAAHDSGRDLRLLVSRVGGPLGHRERSGQPPLENVTNGYENLQQVEEANCFFFFYSQISRMLVVDPKQRFTAKDVLSHSFFSQYVVDEVREFSPYRRFKVTPRHDATDFLGFNKSNSLPPSPPAGHLYDRSRRDAHLLQLPPRQACHQGGDPERPVRRQSHPQAHRCVRLQDLRSLGEERPSPEPGGAL